MLAVPPFLFCNRREHQSFYAVSSHLILAEVGRTEVGIEHVEMLLKL